MIGAHQRSPVAPSPTRTRQLAELVRSAHSVAVLTGAGISVPSGMADFRSPGTGIWLGVDPTKLAHVDAFRRDPERFWHFFGERLAALDDKRPNGAHRALAALEARGMVRTVVTQNVDGLHRRAGSRNVVEVHGSAESASCPGCLARYRRAEVCARLAADGAVPRCDCDAVLKPDVVLFGELLPERALAEAQGLAMDADLMLCAGSSLEVYPVAGLPAMTQCAGGRLVLVTQGPTPYDGDAEVKLDGDVVEELQAVLAALDA